ncbi:LOW QUALITY PROTEIN: uncharacterized protein EMH_0074350 [Eimeria mitis]|uniref:Uncharacterized protein n=1 Tax=Eimeria mitis TaxID=44415 RepID=U6KFF9_9EIME|nr:LOW QUALITY PROTEIN: uncharacterized protein EMH_0074350 [Eimeria mitis]CDJ35511.1 hypothetical protein, conserved [Eimeria mitis]
MDTTTGNSELMSHCSEQQAKFWDNKEANVLEQVVKSHDALLRLQKESFVAASLGSPYGPAVDRLWNRTRTLPQPLLNMEPNKALPKVESKCRTRCDKQLEMARDAGGRKSWNLALRVPGNSCVYSEINQRQEEQLLQKRIGKLNFAPKAPNIRRVVQRNQKLLMQRHRNLLRLLRVEISKTGQLSY